jgi:glycosyltransferase involved in cell wall biosynthesis
MTSIAGRFDVVCEAYATQPTSDHIAHMRPRICHVTSNLNYSLFIEAVAKFLDPQKYEVSFVFLNPERPSLADRIEASGATTTWIRYNTKRDLPVAIARLTKFFRHARPDIVHTHLLDASFVGLTAALLAGIKRRVHTRHHGTEAHMYYPQGVYYDRYINGLSMRVMANTSSVYKTLVDLEHVDPNKIDVINYGYDLADFSPRGGTYRDMRRKYRLEGCWPVVGVISRFVEGKGIQYVIPAFARLLKDCPNAKLVLANAVGDFTQEIESLLKAHLSAERYTLISFEPDVFSLYRAFDVFVHVPIGRDFESFGQTYIEALYMGIPSVFTLSGIANDFIIDGKNALVVPYCDSEAIYNALNKLLTDPSLTAKLVFQGRRDVIDRFEGSRFGRELDEFYVKVLSEAHA